MTARPRVLVLTLGGTISMTASDDKGATPTLGAAAILQMAGSPADVDADEIRTIPGAQLSLDDVLDVHDRVERASQAGYAGVVVVQGTDTIEEVAYALHLLGSTGIPVVVTGAMRHASAPGADGSANVAHAIAASADPRCRDLGVLVVLGGTIHSAGLVRKNNTALPDAFVSWPGPLGVMNEGRVCLDLVPAQRRPRIEILAAPARWPVVPVVTSTLGAAASGIDWLTANPPDGLVVAAFGGGHVPPHWVSPLASLAERCPVVLSSRVATGRVLEQTYAFPGSEGDLLSRGLIAARGLGPIKSSIALTLLLAAEAGQDEHGIAAAHGFFADI